LDFASTQELSSSEILNSLPDVVKITETTDPVIVGISIPIYFACQKAREIGLSYIAAGQLSDEMFGGYGKFEDIALRDGIDNLGREMFDSVLAASAKDFDPGDKLAVAAGLELCCPFAYLPLVEYVLKLPSSLRVNLANGKVIRKYVLRRLAFHLGLPESGWGGRKSCSVFERCPEGFVERSKKEGNQPRKDAGILREIVWKTYPIDIVRKRDQNNGENKPRACWTSTVIVSRWSGRVLQSSRQLSSV